MSKDHWQPSATLATLRARAELLSNIRSFFAEREVLEVETPLLGHSAGTDPQLAPMQVLLERGGENDRAYLQTSPEFAMKRLLAAGSGPIYQLGKAFRDGDLGRRHNPEFTMLEWYRPGFDEHRLMDEVAALVSMVLGEKEIPRCSYRQLFQQHLNIDPHHADSETLATLARQKLDVGFPDEDRDFWLDLLFSHLIEPGLEAQFIYDYPASQAALARLHRNEEGELVARRFELVLRGMEIANGYFELSDSAEQALRFRQDQQLRREAGQEPLPLDMHLLEALEHGLPDCAGVALGVDRLLMLQLGLDDIRRVISFDFGRV